MDKKFSISWPLAIFVVIAITIAAFFLRSFYVKNKNEYFDLSIHGRIERIENADNDYHYFYIKDEKIHLRFGNNEIIKINDSIAKDSGSYVTEVYRNGKYLTQTYEFVYEEKY